jgi:uncharacterized protein (TIGR03435 family)
MVRKTIAILLLVAWLAVVRAQEPPAGFEVVSIKANTALNQPGMVMSPRNGQFRIVNLPLRSIVIYVFDLRETELSTIPDWTRTARFDITATYPASGPRSADDARRMLRSALEDRFQLRVHRESRDVPIYRLVKARSDGRLGPKLSRSAVDCEQWTADKKPPFIGTPPIGPKGARPACLLVAQRAFIVAGTKPITELAVALESIVNRQVVDATELPGNFDLTLEWTPDLDAATAIDDRLSVFTALKEQLGLKLEPAHGTVDVLIVDNIARPTDN